MSDFPINLAEERCKVNNLFCNKQKKVDENNLKKI